jgi:hypothetical protein
MFAGHYQTLDFTQASGLDAIMVLDPTARSMERRANLTAKRWCVVVLLCCCCVVCGRCCARNRVFFSALLAACFFCRRPSPPSPFKVPNEPDVAKRRNLRARYCRQRV